MVNPRGIIRPILTAQGLNPYNEQTDGTPGNTVVEGMLQPILSMQDCGPNHQQTSNIINMGRLNIGNNTSQSTLPALNSTHSKLRALSRCIRHHRGEKARCTTTVNDSVNELNAYGVRRLDMRIILPGYVALEVMRSILRT